MAKYIPTVWKLDPHTQAKHIILRRYLQGWYPVITKGQKRVLYIDGFSGPGIYKNGEEGSPIIALKEAIGHKGFLKAEIVFLFIESNLKRYEELIRQIKVLTIPNNFKVHCVNAKCNDQLTEMLDLLEEQKARLAPTFAFLDPFGFSHTPFSLIQRLMQQSRCEVFITFMYEEINRFLKHTDHPKTFDMLFGCSDWKDGFSLQGAEKRNQFLRKLYIRQLKDSANIKYVQSFEMFNKGNKTDYFLFFGTNHVEGLRKMKDAMWKADESEGIGFSDATDTSQVFLFENTPNFEDLRSRILKKYRGKTVGIEELEEFVLSKTPYRETHIRKNVLVPMEKTEEIIAKSPVKRRRGTFPSGTVIEFL
jgi:three-Cys-motif partner protein